MEDNFRYMVCPICWYEECEEYTYDTYITRQCLACGFEEQEERIQKEKTKKEKNID